MASSGFTNRMWCSDFHLIYLFDKYYVCLFVWLAWAPNECTHALHCMLIRAEEAACIEAAREKGLGGLNESRVYNAKWYCEKGSILSICADSINICRNLINYTCFRIYIQHFAVEMCYCWYTNDRKWWWSCWSWYVQFHFGWNLISLILNSFITEVFVKWISKAKSTAGTKPVDSLSIHFVFFFFTSVDSRR